MNIITWRRHHGDELTANVIVKDLGTCLVAAWHEPSGVVRQSPKMFQQLESAKAEADDLVRRSFRHTCTLETCGEWMIWSA